MMYSYKMPWPVDTDSSINIMPLSVLKDAGIPTLRIVKSAVTISDFDNEIHTVRLKGRTHSLSNQSSCPRCFYGIPRSIWCPWLNKHKLIVSTYHQCVKGRIGLRLICIPRNQTPFNHEETHSSKVRYCDNFTQGDHPSQDHGYTFAFMDRN